MHDPVTAAIQIAALARLDTVAPALIEAYHGQQAVGVWAERLTYGNGLTCRHRVPGWRAHHAITGTVIIEILPAEMVAETTAAIGQWERSIIGSRLKVAVPDGPTATAPAGVLTLQARHDAISDRGVIVLQYVFGFEGGVFVPDAMAEIEVDGFGTVPLPVPGAEDVPHG
ncbi:hypothetical protein [Insolitispirillum peregrinum]|uniref:Uncharacterized protein n=1 Tax=Insolitispirillum peregrinum TaxID=80876 RepID=A0A1N7LRN8_9PROT|nr:hypothetical protein [Insolitispirillum peregrinum]SIS76507.1 hypothetical protein SAMN05421779_103516 [Insolitispirillum peregrinum]